ncbi:MAG: GTP-binding protein [Kiritimatiellia bacterium]
MAGLNETPGGNRVHLAFFGRRNAGKSTLINALTGQQVAIVSDVAGTTTDPVSKAMEILPLGPCLLTDTAGLDDEGELGRLRVRKSLEVLEKTDVAIIVTADVLGPLEEKLIADCARRNVPHLVHVRGDDVEALKRKIAALAPGDPQPPLVSDLVAPSDLVVCVCPIDSAAPKGRLILPQQQVVREILDGGAVAVVCRETELAATLERLGPRNVKFVITDSQAFGLVSRVVPADVPLTSFSLVFARAKGDLAAYCAGVAALAGLKDGDRVLISEGCTHHRQCTDIGTVKLPKWIREKTGKSLAFEWSSGNSFPEDLSPYALVVHCGGCMLTRRAVQARIARCRAAGVPITNYGVCIGACHGIEADAASCMVKRDASRTGRSDGRASVRADGQGPDAVRA